MGIKATETHRSDPIVFATIDDITATQKRQWAKRQAMRLKDGLVERAELDSVVEWKGLSRVDRDRIYVAFSRERDRNSATRVWATTEADPRATL